MEIISLLQMKLLLNFKLLKDLLNDIQNYLMRFLKILLFKIMIIKLFIKIHNHFGNQEYGTKEIELYNSIKNIHAFSRKISENFFDILYQMKNFL